MTKTKVKNFTQSDASQFRTEVKSLVSAQTGSCLALAAALHRVFYGEVEMASRAWKPPYEAWGFQDFHDYAERELGMHGGTARRYVRVHEELIDSPNIKIRNEKLPNSITKLMQLTRVARMEPTRLIDYIRESHRLSCCELEAKIDREFTKKASYRSVSFHMRGTSAATLMVRLRRAMNQLDIETYGEALVTVVEQWEMSRARPKALKRAS